jgi:dihydropteroate synthase
LRDIVRAREAPLLMGVLNCTPDSFSDGGLYLDERRALEHAESMIEAGASIIDVGAESTRPGAARVPASEQITRALPIVSALAKRGAFVSIDTTDAEVAERMLDAGALMVNSVELGGAAALASLASRFDAALVLMHSRGSMEHMAGFSNAPERSYADVVVDVLTEWRRARDAALASGLAADSIVFDPGLGFHKSAEHSLTLVRRLSELAAAGHALLVGPSRKSFLAAVSKQPGREAAPASQRLGATIAACLACAKRGAAILRVHDVHDVAQALAFDAALTARALPSAGPEATSHA